ncbi:hypothetical protein ZWY2020_035733 [Hordeum vulgare]|nr:hypothetical protein ZWY2020_035733 [Hordeum vulgare]
MPLVPLLSLRLRCGRLTRSPRPPLPPHPPRPYAPRPRREPSASHFCLPSSRGMGEDEDEPSSRGELRHACTGMGVALTRHVSQLKIRRMAVLVVRQGREQ